MALYDFKCNDCHKIFEVRLSLKEKETGKEINCISCHSGNTMQLFNSIAIMGGQSSSGMSKGSSGCGSCNHSGPSCSSCG